MEGALGSDMTSLIKKKSAERLESYGFSNERISIAWEKFSAHFPSTLLKHVKNNRGEESLDIKKLGKMKTFTFEPELMPADP